MKEKGYVYVLRDPMNNNIIKVGFSVNPFKRVAQLYNTSTPLPHNISQIWHVEDMRLAEKTVHTFLSGHRINSRREFFEIAPSEDFNEFERTDYEMTSIYLEVLIEKIEEKFHYLKVAFMPVHIERLYQFYLEQGHLLID